jgi:hypothetical protein
VGAFVTPRGDFQGLLPNFGRAVAIADFNRDGIPDVVVTNDASSDVSVLLGRGDGTFEPQRRFNATAAPRALDVGDFNNDDIPDLVVTDSSAAPVINVAILLGRGDGTFEPERTFQVPVAADFSQSGVRIADFNRDGKADLAIGGNDDPNRTVSIYLGNGDGTFTHKTDLSGVRQGFALAVLDLNGDGNPDLAVTGIGNAEGGVSVSLGNGDGTFTNAVEPNSGQPFFISGQKPTALAVADLGSEVTAPDGSKTLGPPDGHPISSCRIAGTREVLCPSVDLKW